MSTRFKPLSLINIPTIISTMSNSTLFLVDPSFVSKTTTKKTVTKNSQLALNGGFILKGI